MKSKITYCDKELIIEDPHKIICMGYDQIALISTNKPYLQITTIDRKTIIFDGLIAELKKNLPDFFFCCNRSILVNLLYVTTFEKICNKYQIHITVLDKTINIASEYNDLFKRKLIEIKNCTSLSPLCLFCKKAYSN